MGSLVLAITVTCVSYITFTSVMKIPLAVFLTTHMGLHFSPATGSSRHLLKKRIIVCILYVASRHG